METDGAVRALVGGPDYGESQFNRATHAKRQPGSSFKVYVYATALENGYKPETTVSDSSPSCGNWHPSNYGGGGGGGGRMPLWLALAKSLNTVAVQLSLKVGREKVIDMTKRVGISNIRKSCSMALGDYGITPLEHTGGIAHFANGGKTARPYAHSRTLQLQGRTGLQPRARRARAGAGRFEDRRAADEPDAAEGRDRRHGPAAQLSSSRTPPARPAPVPGRVTSGSSASPASTSASVWFGNDDNSPMSGGNTGGQLAAPIWHSFMQVVHTDMNIPTIPGLPPHPTQLAEQQRIADLKQSDPAAAAEQARGRNGAKVDEPDAGADARRPAPLGVVHAQGRWLARTRTPAPVAPPPEPAAPKPAKPEAKDNRAEADSVTTPRRRARRRWRPPPHPSTLARARSDRADASHRSRPPREPRRPPAQKARFRRHHACRRLGAVPRRRAHRRPGLELVHGRSRIVADDQALWSLADVDQCRAHRLRSLHAGPLRPPRRAAHEHRGRRNLRRPHRQRGQPPAFLLRLRDRRPRPAAPLVEHRRVRRRRPARLQRRQPPRLHQRHHRAAAQRQLSGDAGARRAARQLAADGRRRPPRRRLHHPRSRHRRERAATASRKASVCPSSARGSADDHSSSGSAQANWRFIATTFCAAAILHIVATLAAPEIAAAPPYSRLRQMLPLNTMQVMPPITADTQPLPFMAPDARYAMCRFDSSNGTVEVTASLPGPGWSLSLHSKEGENFYTAVAQPGRRTDVSLLLIPTDERFTGLTPEAKGKSSVRIRVVDAGGARWDCDPARARHGPSLPRPQRGRIGPCPLLRQEALMNAWPGARNTLSLPDRAYRAAGSSWPLASTTSLHSSAHSEHLERRRSQRRRFRRGGSCRPEISVD